MADKFAIVTGASTGIGFELASLAAASGYDLLVVADEPLIDAAAAQLKGHGVNVRAVEADLSGVHGVERLLAAAEGRPIDLLCANAGRGLGHSFLEQDPAAWRKVVDTNVTGTLYLLQRVLRGMVARGQGKVLVTGSIAGFVPGTFHAVYNASKAFLNNFTDALRNELKEVKGVTLTTLMPGLTDTEFFARAGLLDTSIGASEHKADPATVARDGWNAVMKGEAYVISGLANKLQAVAAHIVPPGLLAEMHHHIAQPGSART